MGGGAAPKLWGPPRIYRGQPRINRDPDWDPKTLCTQMARQDFPNGNCRFCHDGHFGLVGGGGGLAQGQGLGGGGTPPPVVYGHSNTSFENNTTIPKFDGNNTECCSDKGVAFIKGIVGHGSNSRNTRGTATAHGTRDTAQSHTSTRLPMAQRSSRCQTSSLFTSTRTICRAQCAHLDTPAPRMAMALPTGMNV